MSTAFLREAVEALKVLEAFSVTSWPHPVLGMAAVVPEKEAMAIQGVTAVDTDTKSAAPLWLTPKPFALCWLLVLQPLICSSKPYYQMHNENNTSFFSSQKICFLR
jgi:hypothetical protein